MDNWKSDPSVSDYEPAYARRVEHIVSSIISGRFFQIAAVIWKIFCFGDVKSNLAVNLSSQRKILAYEIRESLSNLGVTFIKLGQFLSLRSDIFPLELTNELSFLQDQVLPFPFDQVCSIVHQELGEELGETFQFFEEIPIASASIGQVHRAVLKNGTKVAVKVQRPDINGAIYQDLGTLLFLVRLGKFLQLMGDWQNWHGLINEFGRCLFIEMNYLQEGKNADQIRKVMRDLPFIIVPRIIWRYSSKRVITEELCEGIKIDNVGKLAEHGYDLKRLANCLVKAYLEQIFVHGCFHADPHAGNFSITEGQEIIIYDFGLVEYLTSEQRQGLLKTVFGIVAADVNVVVEGMVLLGIMQPIKNEGANVIKEMVEAFINWSKTSLAEEMDLSRIEKQIDTVLSSQALKLPINLAYLLRTSVALEAVVHKLNPEFNLIRATKPYLKRMN